MWIINETCVGLALRKINCAHESNRVNEEKLIKRNWWSSLSNRVQSRLILKIIRKRKSWKIEINFRFEKFEFINC